MDLDAENMDGNNPNGLEGKVGEDLDAEKLDGKDTNGLKGKHDEELDAEKVDGKDHNGLKGVQDEVFYYGAAMIDKLVGVKKLFKENPFKKQSKHHCVKAMGSREIEEPSAFKNDDSHDESFRKQQEVVDAAIQLMRHDEPFDTRDGQLVYIERVSGVANLGTNGRIEKCYDDPLVGIPGTTQCTNYLKHDLVL
ncbi:hypothetical protein D1007_42198 [Hordeum vulgare]|nr:hypothetical protein D1007_42198 [Hordeum vulgare]